MLSSWMRRAALTVALAAGAMSGCGPSNAPESGEPAMGTTEQEVVYPCSYEQPTCRISGQQCNFDEGICLWTCNGQWCPPNRNCCL
ncbi:hypothetical protein HPC49_02175 [Pyxidicoccus fallax]|uniref:Lipoprotein n=1 Tax=Pyxidicoccus fallax TaxID=394095 RepID=A0A848LE89_9BACT|nr:hypothetical protein [Pyxidicoccus fallax]NMO14541.1 hypothetical protein [Pyxidicoccus fallax]NPC77060.1 hypothetical protein [Pyxidicoccus fallax]